MCCHHMVFFGVVILAVSNITLKPKNLKKDHNILNIQAQMESIPIELLTLINFVQDVIDASIKGFSKESLAISQTIMHNFRSNRDKKNVA